MYVVNINKNNGSPVLITTNYARLNVSLRGSSIKGHLHKNGKNLPSLPCPC